MRISEALQSEFAWFEEMSKVAHVRGHFAFDEVDRFAGTLLPMMVEEQSTQCAGIFFAVSYLTRAGVFREDVLLDWRWDLTPPDAGALIAAFGPVHRRLTELALQNKVVSLVAYGLEFATGPAVNRFTAWGVPRIPAQA